MSEHKGFFLLRLHGIPLYGYTITFSTGFLMMVSKCLLFQKNAAINSLVHVPPKRNRFVDLRLGDHFLALGPVAIQLVTASF